MLSDSDTGNRFLDSNDSYNLTSCRNKVIKYPIKMLQVSYIVMLDNNLIFSQVIMINLTLNDIVRVDE